MKKIVLCSILSSYILVAGDSNLQEVKNKGIEYFKNNDFKSAIKEFSKIDDYKDSESIDFYLARSYYEIGEYEKALIVFERISINDPENMRVKLEIAQTYLMLNSYDTAKIFFQELLNDNTIPIAVRNNIENRLKNIDKKNNKNLFSSSIMFGWGYDTNINNTTNEDSFNINSSNLGLVNVQSSDKVNSTFYETAALFNHMYKFDEETYLKNSVVFYRQDFTKDRTKKLDVISLSTTPILKKDNMSYGINFSFDNVLYGNNHYLNNYSISPKISYAIDSTKIYETSLKITNKDFVRETDKGNDSFVYEYQNKLILQSEKLGLFDVSLTLGRETDEKNTRYDVSKDYETISLGNTYKLDEKLALNSSVQFSNVNYKDSNPLFVGKRHDDIYSLLLNLSYFYDNNTVIGLTYNHTEQDSTYTPNDYDKDLIKSSVIYTF